MVFTIQHVESQERSSDATLIARSMDDGTCFGTLFDRHADSIYRFAAARVGPTRAEDVVSDVFAIAFDRRATFHPESTSARPWLYGIAANRLKKLRKARIGGSSDPRSPDRPVMMATMPIEWSPGWMPSASRPTSRVHCVRSRPGDALR